VAVVFLAATYISTGLYGNYMKAPVLFVIPLAAVGALFGTFCLSGGAMAESLFCSAVFIFTVTLFGSAECIPICLYPA